MAMQINTNVMALNAQRHLTITGTRFAKSLEQLTGAMHINRAAIDDRPLRFAIAVLAGICTQLHTLPRLSIAVPQLHRPHCLPSPICAAMR